MGTVLLHKSPEPNSIEPVRLWAGHTFFSTLLYFAGVAFPSEEPQSDGAEDPGWIVTRQVREAEMFLHGAHPLRRMSRHLFQLGRLSGCSAASLDQFSRSESAACHAALLSECTDSLQLFTIW
jgi:hypothetical protein